MLRLRTMMDAQALVLRDGILLVAWLTAVYLVFTLLSLSQLGRKYGLQSSEMLSAVASAKEDVAAVAPVTARQPSNSVAPEVSRTLRVSPRYEVAISLAFQGFDVASIARRCDISVGEAKLVAALAQSYQGLERPQEEHYDEERDSRAAA